MRASYWVVLAVNVAWFGLGFQLFALRPHKAIRLLVSQVHKEERSRVALLAALPFLGGMNLAFAALSAAPLVGAMLFIFVVDAVCATANVVPFLV